jgi:peptide subunit release factor 1 (eRF1)
LVQTFKEYHLNRARMLEFLAGIASEKDGERLTVFIPPRLAPEKLKDVLQKVPAAPNISREMYDICTASTNGAVIFWGDRQKKLIVSPFPIRDSVIMAGFETEHLKAMLEQDFTIGLVLIRLGYYGIGVCKGDKLISSKIGTGLVHSRHRQGGSSSHRFERHRDKQMETFFIRVCEHAREQLEPYEKKLDYIVYGGAWETIQLFVKYCPFLSKLNKPILPTLSDTPEPKRAVLEKAAGRVYASTMYEWEFGEK